MHNSKARKGVGLKIHLDIKCIWLRTSVVKKNIKERKEEWISSIKEILLVISERTKNKRGTYFQCSKIVPKRKVKTRLFSLYDNTEY